MQVSNILALMTLIGAAIVTPPTYAVIVIDANAPVVQLRTSCVDATTGLDVNNCFTTTVALNDWIDNTRLPNATKPLLVEIGPGTFGSMNLFCAGSYSDITIRGAGRGRTVLNTNYPFGAGFNEAGSCQNISVEDLTITGSFAGVVWFGGGSSNWTNVEMKGGSYGRFDAQNNNGAVCNNKGLHKFYSSTISASPGSGSAAFYNACGVNWLWGSEITTTVPSYATSGTMSAVQSTGAGNEMHIYGSNVSVNIPSTSAAMPVQVISATGGAQVHAHGTGIDAIAAGASAVVVLSATSGSTIHANASSYNLKTGTGGTITRIVKDTNSATHVHASYLWEEHPNAPVVTSATGADLAVVTTTADTRPHLLIHDITCASKWFDTSTKLCR